MSLAINPTISIQLSTSVEFLLSFGILFPLIVLYVLYYIYTIPYCHVTMTPSEQAYNPFIIFIFIVHVKLVSITTRTLEPCGVLCLSPLRTFLIIL